MIGAGSGGVRAARISAGHGARVAVIEKPARRDLCHTRLRSQKTADVWLRLFSRDRRCQWLWMACGGGRPRLAVTDREPRTVSLTVSRPSTESLLANAGVELIEGRGIVTGLNNVRVGERDLTAERILVATGGWPQIPDAPGLAEACHYVERSSGSGETARPGACLWRWLYSLRVCEHFQRIWR